MVTITTPLTTASGVNDVFIAEDRYAVLATTLGVEIVDLLAGSVISSGTLPSEPLCVAADYVTATGNLYVGTTSSGIFTVRWHPLREPGLDFSGSLVQRFTTTSTPPISSNQVQDLSALPMRLLISTGSGLDFLTSENLRATRALVSGSEDCQMTEAGEAYWTVVNSGVEANYDLFPSSGTGIINVDFEYNATSSDPLLPHNIVNDIAVVPNPNLLGFATNLGAFIVEEQQFAEATSQTLTLFPESEPAVSVDFSEEATFSGGVVYVATSGSVQIFGLVDTAISGTHFHDLSRDNTRGQTLVTGTVTVVRTTSVA
jgi:hypothetical protein